MQELYSVQFSIIAIKWIKKLVSKQAFCVYKLVLFKMQSHEKFPLRHDETYGIELTFWSGQFWTICYPSLLSAPAQFGIP